MAVCSLSSIGRKAYLGPRPALSAPCHYRLCLPTDTPDSRLNLILCLCVYLQKVRIPNTESCQSSGFLVGKLCTFASIDFSSSTSTRYFFSLIMLCSTKRGIGKYIPNATAKSWKEQSVLKFENWVKKIKTLITANTTPASGPDYKPFLYNVPLHNVQNGREVTVTPYTSCSHTLATNRSSTE